MKSFASTPKSGGEGGGGGGGEGKGICAVIVLPINGNRKPSKCNQIFHKYELLLPRLKILPPNPLAKQHVFLIKRFIVIGLVRKKLSNMPSVFSKSIRGYFLPIS